MTPGWLTGSTLLDGKAVTALGDRDLSKAARAHPFRQRLGLVHLAVNEKG